MANKIKLSTIKHLTLFTWVVLLSNCSDDKDLSGAIYASDSVNDRFEQSIEWNKIHPSKHFELTSEHYSILVGADSHIGGTKNFNALVAEARKPENLALVMIGDLVSGQKEDYEILNQNLPSFNEVPYFLMVGNHDLFFNGWKTFYEYFGSSTYYFTVSTPTANDIYICIDSGSGTIGNKQLEWLISLLTTERANYRNCIVLTHVNFFRNHNQIATNPLVDEIYVLLDLFAKNQINLVITGHDHRKAVYVFGNTTYITLNSIADSNKTPSYLNINISDQKADYEFHDFK